jgi:hypothetical protein
MYPSTDAAWYFGCGKWTLKPPPLVTAVPMVEEAATSVSLLFDCFMAVAPTAVTNGQDAGNCGSNYSSISTVVSVQ